MTFPQFDNILNIPPDLKVFVVATILDRLLTLGFYHPNAFRTSLTIDLHVYTHCGSSSRVVKIPLVGVNRVVKNVPLLISVWKEAESKLIKLEVLMSWLVAGKAAIYTTLRTLECHSSVKPIRVADCPNDLPSSSITAAISMSNLTFWVIR
jgi:hypothetical protein